MLTKQTKQPGFVNNKVLFLPHVVSITEKEEGTRGRDLLKDT